MKRLIGLILCLLMILPGCSADTKKDQTVFYYCRADYAYGTEEAVVAPEEREMSAKASDWKNLLALYLVGPLDETLVSPFSGTKLRSAEMQGNHLLIVLEDSGENMTDVRFSLACACVTKTCLEWQTVSHVTIVCGERSVTMNRNNLLLHDSITPIETATEETQ